LESLLVKCEYFNPKDTLECGQVFRFQKTENTYRIFAGNKAAILKTDGQNTEIFAEDLNFFKDYFDLSKDYAKIADKLKINSIMERAVNFGKGIRILRQDPFEALISFIISQNNHIPRIKSIIERLCENLGKKESFSGFTYYGFPDAEIMARQSVEFYRKIGAGYRAEYLLDTVGKIADGFNLKELFNIDSLTARKKLCSLLGVGPKVADCVLLFAYNKSGVFPVDTWIKKVYHEYFNGGETNPVKISEYFKNEFRELSGYAQQYLFYYKRNFIN